MIERFIDYLQFTANFNMAEFTKAEFKEVSGVPYYPRGFRSHSGVRFNFGHNKGANCFVILAGEQLQYLRDMGQTDVGTLEWAFANGAKVSRIDLAVTEWIEDDLFLMGDIEEWYKKDLIRSALVEDGIAKAISSVGKEEKTLETVYIGDMKKRGKKGIFRAYDKGIDLGIGSEIVSRIELELKRKKADIVANRIVKTGDIAGNFRAYFDVNHQTFDRIMESPAIEAKRGKGKPKTVKEDEDNKRWDWLLNQVAPALREAIRGDIDAGLGEKRMFEFMMKSGMIERAEDFAAKWAEFKFNTRMIERTYILD